MAPFFGASTIVWANTIGVVLVALSLGYWFGGRLADRSPSIARALQDGPARVRPARRGPVRRPAVLRHLGRRARLDLGRRVRRIAVRGARPGRGPGAPARRRLAVRAAPRRARRRARGPGRRPPLRDLHRRLARRHDAVVAAADPGPRHPADLPRLRAARSASPRSPVSAALRAGRGRRSPPRSRSRSAPSRQSDDGEVIYETETETQYAQVVEETDGDRILQLNEGQAIHSLYKPDSYLTGRYWDGLIVLPFAALDRPPERVAILGNAAGTAARMYGHYFPDARVDGVEIDGELTEHRPALLRPPGAQPPHLHRRRPALAASAPTATTT